MAYHSLREGKALGLRKSGHIKLLSAFLGADKDCCSSRKSRIYWSRS
jgi:hypothetical protein